MSWDWEVANLYQDMKSFLENHSISELIDLVRIVVEEREEQT